MEGDRAQRFAAGEIQVFQVKSDRNRRAIQYAYVRERGRNNERLRRREKLWMGPRTKRWANYKVVLLLSK